MNALAQTVVLPVSETSQVGEARRVAATLALQSGLGSSRQSDLAILATEAARNLVQHARQGRLLLRSLREGEHRGVELISVDAGPGMADVTRCLEDGYSTAGTSGTGLGAIRRLAHYFDIYSQPGAGTVLVARISENRIKPHEELPVEVGVICAAKPSETVCGDCWAVKAHENRISLLVADGLGHGPDAAEASREAARHFLRSAGATDSMLQDLHQQLRRTRGAAVAVADIFSGQQHLQFWGVGNISGHILDGPQRPRMVSLHGTVGLELPRLRSFEYPWSRDALMILHSDGLTTRWQLEAYPGLMRRDPALVAAVLYRDFTRGHDDVTVLVVRMRRTVPEPERQQRYYVG